MEITFMREVERSEVELFVNQAMHRAYRCIAYPLPRQTLVARRSGTLVGTIAFLEPEEGVVLPLELTYDIDWRQFPGGQRPSVSSIIQFGRWVGLASYVSEILLYEAARYALRRNYAWAVSEVKPQVGRHFRRLQMPMMLLAGVLRRDRVPSAVLPYYDPPSPAPCIALLRSIELVLGRRIRERDVRYMGLRFSEP